MNLNTWPKDSTPTHPRTHTHARAHASPRGGRTCGQIHRPVQDNTHPDYWHSSSQISSRSSQINAKFRSARCNVNQSQVRSCRLRRHIVIDVDIDASGMGRYTQHDTVHPYTRPYCVNHKVCVVVESCPCVVDRALARVSVMTSSPRPRRPYAASPRVVHTAAVPWRRADRPRRPIRCRRRSPRPPPPGKGPRDPPPRNYQLVA